MTIPIAKVPVDFQNADSDGFLRLNCFETIAFFESNKIVLREGQEFVFFDDDIEARGVVISPGKEGVWRAKIDWRALLGQRG